MTEGSGEGVIPPQKQNVRKDAVKGIPLGGFRDPRDPVLSAFQARGVLLNKNTATNLRGGKTPGTEIEERLLAREVLEADDASKKNQLYGEIARKGVEIREPQKPPNEFKLNSDSFTEALARSLDIHPQILRRIIRAMRADVIYSADQGFHPSFVQRFKAIANDFVEVHTKRGGTTRSEKIQGMKEIRVRWSGNIEDFYRLLYERFGGRALGTWTPYEIEAFREFYVLQVASGNKLTPFDRLVLETKNKGRGIFDLVGGVRRTTGISIGRESIQVHRNILLYTKP